jgi:hypothetical protein
MAIKVAFMASLLASLKDRMRSTPDSDDGRGHRKNLSLAAVTSGEVRGHSFGCPVTVKYFRLVLG